MESNQLPGWKGSTVSYWLNKHVDEEDNRELKGEVSLPAIPQPETPNEPMEFLSRSWSLSANEISKALATKQQMQPAFNSNVITLTQSFTPQSLYNKLIKPGHGRMRGGGAIGRLFHHKERIESTTLKNKDKARMENARTHTFLSIAGLAAALAAATSTEKSKSSTSKISKALASATELLASYCIELAESAGVNKEDVASVVRSAVDMQTASDLLTLTAAAATDALIALRGEAVMNARLPKEAKRSASISPYEKATACSQSPATFCSEKIKEDDLPCIGDLLQLTRKGVLRWKYVSVYINKAYQVTIKVKSKHVGGAFSKNNKCTLYEVIDDNSWPFRKERTNMELHFGVKTAQGLLEFKCRNKVDKQKWVHGIQNLLHRRSRFEEAENSLRMLNITKSI